MRKLLDPAAVAAFIRELIGLAGAGCVVKGVSLAYAPAAWIVAGGFAMAYAFLASRKAP